VSDLYKTDNPHDINKLVTFTSDLVNEYIG